MDWLLKIFKWTIKLSNGLKNLENSGNVSKNGLMRTSLEILNNKLHRNASSDSCYL